MLYIGDSFVSARIQCGCMLVVSVQPGMVDNPFTTMFQPCPRCHSDFMTRQDYHAAVRARIRHRFYAQTNITEQVDMLIEEMYPTYTAEDIDRIKLQFQVALGRAKQPTK